MGRPVFGEGYTFTEEFLDYRSCNLFTIEGADVVFRKGLACFLIQPVSDMVAMTNIYIVLIVFHGENNVNALYVDALHDSKGSSRLCSASVVSGSCLSGKWTMLAGEGILQGNFSFMLGFFICISTSQHIKDMMYQKDLTVMLGFQTWEQSAGVMVFPNIQLLASEVSKLLTKEIKRNLNGKPAGNDSIPYPLDPLILRMCCHSAVFSCEAHREEIGKC